MQNIYKKRSGTLSTLNNICDTKMTLSSPPHPQGLCHVRPTKTEGPGDNIVVFRRNKVTLLPPYYGMLFGCKQAHGVYIFLYDSDGRADNIETLIIHLQAKSSFFTTGNFGTLLLLKSPRCAAS